VLAARLRYSAVWHCCDGYRHVPWTGAGEKATAGWVSDSSERFKMLLNRPGNGALGNKTPHDLESVAETPPSVKQIKQYLPQRPFYFLPEEQ